MTGAAVRTAALTLALLGLAAGLTHGELAGTQPADRSVLNSAPTKVNLSFTEPVEVPFSVFKVYPLEAPLPQGAPCEHDWQRLNGLAGALVSEVLTRRGDEDARADIGIAAAHEGSPDGTSPDVDRGPERRSDEVVIMLKEDLHPGVYVLMWRVLAIDTHITQGFITFIVNTEKRHVE